MDTTETNILLPVAHSFFYIFLIFFFKNFMPCSRKIKMATLLMTSSDERFYKFCFRILPVGAINKRCTSRVCY